MKEIIRNQDQAFHTKANKSEFFTLRETKLDKELLEQLSQRLDIKISQTSNELKSQRQLLDIIQEKMQESIYEAVKKANASIIKAQEKLEEKRRKQAAKEMKELEQQEAMKRRQSRLDQVSS